MGPVFGEGKAVVGGLEWGDRGGRVLTFEKQ